MTHNDVARRTVRVLPLRSLASRRSPGRRLCREAVVGAADPTLRPLVRTLTPRSLARRTEGGRLDELDAGLLEGRR
ncbi:hypothetical protein P3T36_004672 [Kitasatospora sp. MAP12-15]|uniref:hypothetical protein n=1 Tax=unclassified Kitasatospora TaxID=2633591 RepID=UPI00247458FD|nr:hypothetical protein [Kitasatospora sp. MAP12-44]MDH6111518.1 hypothetical protein [Kitasatospora sp. MAP12-44]